MYLLCIVVLFAKQHYYLGYMFETALILDLHTDAPEITTSLLVGNSSLHLSLKLQFEIGFKLGSKSNFISALV